MVSRGSPDRKAHTIMGIFTNDGTRVTKDAFPATDVDPLDVPRKLTEDLFTTKKYDVRNDTVPEGSIRTRLALAGQVMTQREVNELFPTAVVMNVSPANGPAAGGTKVTIFGQHLDGVSKVTVGGADAGAVNVLSDTQIEVTTPAGTAGAQDVVVTDDSGTATDAGAFTYE